MDLCKLSATQILALSVPQLRRDAQPDPQKTYRRLVSQWHPDRCPDPQAAEVCAYLREGLINATDQLRWRFTTHEGKRFELSEGHWANFELGRRAVARHTLLYLLEPQYRRYAGAGVSLLKRLKFADPAMREQLVSQLGSVRHVIQGDQGSVVVLTKDPEEVFLSDAIFALNALDEETRARHVAWILSSLYNVCCYLQFSQIAHHGIEPASILLNPIKHRVRLAGGWWHGGHYGEAFDSLPRALIEAAPRSYLSAKKRGPRLDLEAAKRVGRWCLGDASGMSLKLPKQAAPLASFLKLPAAELATEDYRAWREAVEQAFGAPRFVPWSLSFNDIYKE